MSFKFVALVKEVLVNRFPCLLLTKRLFEFGIDRALPLGLGRDVFDRLPSEAVLKLSEVETAGRHVFAVGFVMAGRPTSRAPPARALLSGAADGVVLCRRGLLDADGTGLAIPKDLHGTGPSMAGAHPATVLGVERSTFEVVPQDTNGPAVMRTGITVCAFIHTIQKHVGSANLGSRSLGMTGFTGIAPLNQAELSVD